MKQKTAKVLMLMIVACIVLILLFVYKDNEAERTYPEAFNYSFISINELQTLNVSSGYFNVEGYVIDTFPCSYCPREARCKTCVANIIISQEKEIFNVSEMSDGELILYSKTGKLNELELYKKYLFSVNVTSEKKMINNIEILGYSRVG